MDDVGIAEHRAIARTRVSSGPSSARKAARSLRAVSMAVELWSKPQNGNAIVVYTTEGKTTHEQAYLYQDHAAP